MTKLDVLSHSTVDNYSIPSIKICKIRHVFDGLFLHLLELGKSFTINNNENKIKNPMENDK